MKTTFDEGKRQKGGVNLRPKTPRPLPPSAAKPRGRETTAQHTFTIQIGDKPGWDKPVLNVMRDDGTSVAVSLLRREANELKELGVGVEG